MVQEDAVWMDLALFEARKAFCKGEVPVGAVIVKDGLVLGKGHNLKETLSDPTAHAEISAIREASRRLGDWRLEGSDMYTTLEPCPMCAGAMVLARISRLIVGAKDPKTGAAGTVIDLLNDERFNHRVEVKFGVREKECAFLLKSFFANLRRGVGAVERARLESE